ncbi:MAG: YDG domain-containing protein, partial [Verrucomicrobia bacterium]|nr:YDG domain-containing protein [Verrucomicrobiota bacterium]
SLTGTASLTGVIVGDTANVSLAGSPVATFATKTVATGKTVTVTGYSLTGSAAGNYSLTQPTTTANITAKPVTVTGVTAQNKEYDRTTAATLNTGSAALAGAVGGDSVSVTTVGATGTFPAKTVGTGLTVTTAGFGLAGADSGNYSLSQPSTTADITAKALTVAGLTATSRSYNQGTGASLVTGAASLTGVIGGDTVTLDSASAVGAFANKNIGTAKPVTVTGLALAGTDAGNYTLTTPVPTADITAVALTVSGITASNKVYDATLAATINTAGSTLSAPLGGEIVTLVTGSATGSFATKVIGTGKTVTIGGLSLTGADAGNYVVTAPTTTADITAATLTIANVTAVNRTYDASAVATLSTGTAALVGKASGDDVTLSVASATGAFADKTVGTGKTVTTAGFSLGGADAGNYTLTQPSTTASIAALAVSVTGATANSKTYDGNATATIASTGSLTGAIGGDTVTLTSGSATATFSNKAVGTGKTVTFAGFTLTGADAGNYTLSQPTTTATITAKGVTVAGTTGTNRVYDATTAATAVFTGSSLVGVVGGDTVSLVTSGAVSTFATKTVGTGKTVTVTGLALGGTDAGNYTLTQPTTTADITAKALTVAGITATSRVYDAGTVATLSTGSAALVGIAGSDDVTLSTGSATGAFATKTAATGKVVTVSGLALGGTDASNYTLTAPTALADITAKVLTVSGTTAANKTYDGALTAAPNFTSSALVGVIGGDTVSLVSSSGTATFATKVVATGKTVQVAGLTLSGADAANYSLAQPATTADITAKALTVSGITALNRIYDSTTVAGLTTGGAALVGVVGGDTVTLSTASAAGAFATKVVGTAKTVQVSGLTIGGADAANYTLTQPSATADITAKALTVTGVTAASKTFNASPVATLSLGSATLVGVISGDVATLVTSGATGAFVNANAGTGKSVQVSGLTLAGADAGNYTVTQPTTTANISQANTLIAITGLSHTYDGSPKAATITLTPAVNSTVVYSTPGGAAPTNAGSYQVTVTVLDSNFAGTSSATLVIAKASQTVAFSITGSNFAIGSTLGLVASASSGLPVTFSVVSGSATLSGSSVTVTQAGPVSLRATQAGNDNYLPATADQGFTGVSGTKTAQTINFAALPNVTTDDASLPLLATATSGLPVTFTVVSGPAFLITANTLSFTGAPGVVIVRASQAGNATFAAAPDVLRGFTIVNANPDTFFGDLTDDPGTFSGGDRGELIQSGGPRLDAKTGDIAAVLYPGTPRRGSIIIVSPLLGLNVSLNFTVTDSGTYTVPFTSGGRSFTLTGTLNGTTLTGRIPLLKVSFITQALAKAGLTAGIAGFYDTDALNAGQGGTASVVGPNGQLLIVATAGSLTTGALGSVGADGKFNVSAPGATITGAVDAPTTTVSGTITVPGQTPLTFSGLAATTSRTDRLINLSSRVRIGPAAGRTLITGFVIGGGAPKRVLLRAVGPALTGFGVQGALSNPRLQLYDGTGKLVLENDDWSGSDTSATTSQVGAFSLVPGSKDAALFTTLAPGAYTMHVIDGGETGVALAEIYDASVNPNSEYQRLVNISTRGEAGIGENVLIGGFIVTGNAPKKVLVRGIGPGLAAFGVDGTLADPRLRVYRDKELVGENDNWSAGTAEATAAVAQAARDTGAFALTAASKDASVILTLAPGAYTAQVGSADGTSVGVALVEIYEIP